MNHRLDKLERHIRPRAAAAPFRVVVHRVGDSAPGPEDGGNPNVLLIRVIPLSKAARYIEAEPADDELEDAVAELEGCLAESLDIKKGR
ncbi:MAG: hypothetical protein MUQ00_13550 [Candidatus Aminicenantes bacterium]|nr:hypothetical protein [Candidatus Aminicenantes bacterium]